MSVVVLTPAAAKQLTTVADVRLDLGLAATVPSDAHLVRWIDQMSDRAARYCRRTFGRETVQERFERGSELSDGPICGLYLDRTPVVSIGSVTVDGVLQDADSYTLLGRAVQRVVSGDPFACWSGRMYVVEYEAGFLLPGETRGGSTALDLPSDIERAAVLLVGVAVSGAGRDTMIRSEQADGIFARSYYVQGASAELPHPEAEALLGAYRRPLVA